MEKNGVLLIAGKGHENYQEIKGVRYSFCDFKIVDEFFHSNYLKIIKIKLILTKLLG